MRDIKTGTGKLGLRQLQKLFTSALLENTLSYDVETQLGKYDRGELDERLAVYRNNIYYSLTDVLQDTFPSVAAMVGEEFFTALAQAYIRKHPPTNAAMVHLGASFPGFIDEFLPTIGQLPQLNYLGDLGRLDWARHQAYHAAEATPLSNHAFVSLTTAELASAQLTLHPSLQLVISPHSIFSLWEFACNDAPRTPAPKVNQPEQVLVVRPEALVETLRISPSLARMFELLASSSLGEALENTALADNTFDASAAVAFLISSRAVIAVR